MIIHPARSRPFRELREALEEARSRRLVSALPGPDGLCIYCYTNICVFDQQWTETTISARGLVLDLDEQRVAATPFPKFFNLGERGQPIPELPFEATEKLDGSLIILFHHRGAWRTATKGAFASAQALWARQWLAGRDLSPLRPGTTYLAEAIYPENRIVVKYQAADLVLLAAYDEGGVEAPYRELCDLAERLGWRIAGRHHFASLRDLVAHASALPATAEGFVLRFEDGLRLKVKGDEYRRIHALISRVTPLAIWEAMAAGDDLVSIRRQLPEEFWGDFDRIVTLLEARVAALVEEVDAAAQAAAALSDKEVGLRLHTLPDRVRPFIFAQRKTPGGLLAGKPRQAVFRALRPTANQLAGYVPSYAINRVIDDAL
jgi:RNA ligase